jgi:hypothetical protein
MNKEEKQKFTEELKQFFSQGCTSDFDREHEVFDEDEEDIFDFTDFLNNVLIVVDSNGTSTLDKWKTYPLYNSPEFDKKTRDMFALILNQAFGKFGKFRIELNPTTFDQFNCGYEEIVSVLYFIDKNLYVKFSGTAYTINDYSWRDMDVNIVIPETITTIKYNKENE